MRLIDDREKRTHHRMAKKDAYDSLITLSTGEKVKKLSIKPKSIKFNTTDGDFIETEVRLLDEGAITCADGSIDIYISKGVLKKYYDELSDDYVGSINIGHSEFATNPDKIVGTWKKENLTLKDIGEGRQALFCNMRVLKEHPSIKALSMMPFDFGVSVEMLCHFNDDLSLKATREYQEGTGSEEYITVCDDLFIFDYAIVGDCGNVRSGGIDFKGAKKMNLDLKNLANALDENKSSDDNMKLLQEAIAKECTKEEDTKEGEAKEDTSNEKNAEETLEDESDKVLKAIDELKKENEELKAKIEKLEKEAKAKEEKLEKLAANNKAFADKVLNLKVSRGSKEVVSKPNTATYTDGIGTIKLGE